MNIFLEAVHLLALGLLFELIECSSGGKDSGLNSHFRKPRSKSLTTDSYYDHASSRSERPREGLRRMNVIMPSEEEKAAARLEFRRNPTLENGKGVFDDVKYRISILQIVDNGEPDLATYQFFPGSPITMDTIRRAKLQRQRDNAHKDPKLFLCADDSNSSSSSSSSSDSSDDKAGSSNGQNLRRRGNSLGTYTEKKKSKKYLKLEKEWDRLREEDLKKEVELAKKKEKARKKREKERESESKEEAKKSEKGDRKKKWKLFTLN